MDEAQIEKVVSRRLSNLFSDEKLVSVFAKHGFEPFRRSCVLQGLHEFLVEAVGDRGKEWTMFEIGTHHGISALVLSRFFGSVWTFDPAESEFRKKILNRTGVKFGRPESFDVAFLDGDHAGQTQQDFDSVRICGRVLFHEYWEAQPSVVALVDSLPGRVLKRPPFAWWESQ